MNALLVAGTKKPLRLFFVPLTLPEKEPRPELFFSYKKSQVKLPYNLKLVCAPKTDVGQTGMWNHWEFLLRLLSLGDTHQFCLQELLFQQGGLSSYYVTGIAAELGRPGQVPAGPSRPSVPVFAAENWSAFDDPLLADHGPPPMAGLVGEPHEPDDVNDDTGLHGLDMLFEDEFALELDIQSDAENNPDDAEDTRMHVRQPQHVPNDDAESPRSVRSTGSRMSGHTKEVSTDVDLLANVLGPRP